MRGYYTRYGYMGWVDGVGYQLFETEDAYYEWKLETYPEMYEYHAP